MALDPSNGLTYFLSIDREHLDYLGAIRHWNNLRIGFEGDLVWLKDFTLIQLEGIEVKSVPYKQLYYSSGAKLYLQGSLLPERGIPPLLWTPIDRGLPVTLPAFNHNYFGVREKVAINIIPSNEEKEAAALLTSSDALAGYIQHAPEVRLKQLSWIIIDSKCLILGTPVLPVQGEAFWKEGDFLFPAGYNLDLYALNDSLQTVLNKTGEHFILWNKTGTYSMLPKTAFSPLSIASFRLSLKE